MQVLEAVIFDMDGTLVDSERVSQEAWKRAARDLGIELPGELIHSFIGRTAPSVHALMVGHLGGDDELAKECFRLHFVHFDQICETDLTLMPGACGGVSSCPRHLDLSIKGDFPPRSIRPSRYVRLDHDRR